MIKRNNKLPDIVIYFSQWYQEVIRLAELSDQSDTKGCIIVLPYGNALWEKITMIMNQKIKEMQVSNMLFPLLIPYSFFEKEKEHIEGFAPEVAVVTHAGGRKLDDPLVVRPTSEVIIHDYFKKKIKSWRDLPLKVNQWCNVVRWEKRPRAFLRTSEFWWQEGHTAHACYDEALEQAENAIKMYADFCREYLAIPVIVARKPDYERFAGAEITWTIEGMMQDGKAVQMGTSHLLGEGFAKSQNMEFQDKDMQVKIPYLTSWGVTTRLIGTLIMVHGDQNGLVMPPCIAPILFSIIPIFKNKTEKEKLLCVLSPLKDFFLKSNIDYIFDDREEITPGAKFFESEIKGIPFRIEVGMRDLEKGQFTLFERDINKKTHFAISLLSYVEKLDSLIVDLKRNMQQRMFEKAILFQKKNTFIGEKLSNFGSVLIERNGFCITYWCGEDSHLFKEYQSSVRCVLECKQGIELTCCLHANCKKEKMKVLVARSY